MPARKIGHWTLSFLTCQLIHEGRGATISVFTLAPCSQFTVWCSGVYSINKLVIVLVRLFSKSLMSWFSALLIVPAPLFLSVSVFDYLPSCIFLLILIQWVYVISVKLHKQCVWSFTCWNIFFHVKCNIRAFDATSEHSKTVKKLVKLSSENVILICLYLHHWCRIIVQLRLGLHQINQIVLPLLFYWWYIRNQVPLQKQ